MLVFITDFVSSLYLVIINWLKRFLTSCLRRNRFGFLIVRLKRLHLFGAGCRVIGPARCFTNYCNIYQDLDTFVYCVAVGVVMILFLSGSTFLGVEKFLR